MQQGKDPSEVADRVIQAIIKNNFWILTHEDWKPILEQRVAALIRDNSLHEGFVG